MAVRDQATYFDVYQGSYDAITSATTTVGAIFDTAQFELGFTVTMSAPVYSTGTFTLVLEESDDPAMAGAVAIDADKLIGDLPVITAVTVDGIVLGKVGVFSNLRYIRVSVLSANTPSATIRTTVIKHSEICPPD